MSELDFTGERYIPGKGSSEIAYEHLHRYLFCLRWAGVEKVLDVAAGSGYGASILARNAGMVWAMDINEEAIGHALHLYKRPNLNFVRGNAFVLPFKAQSMDLVVAMEVLEHIKEQNQLVSELSRVVKPNGVVLISTPNKATYSDARDYTNPYHIKELYPDEFNKLLHAAFSSVEIVRQQVRAGSLIAGTKPKDQHCEIITDPISLNLGNEIEPMYFIAVCSNAGETKPAPSKSAFIDLTDSLFQEWEKSRDVAQTEIEKLNDEISRMGEWTQVLNDEISEIQRTVDQRDKTIQSLQAEMKREISRRDQAIDHLQAEFEERSQWVNELQEGIYKRDKELERVDGELHRVAGHLARIRHAILYRILCRLGILPK